MPGYEIKMARHRLTPVPVFARSGANGLEQKARANGATRASMCARMFVSSSGMTARRLRR